MTSLRERLKKLSAFLIALVAAAIIIQIIAAAITVILNIPFISGLPKIVGTVISILAIAFAIVLGILIFKKTFSYLKKEFQNI